MTNNNPSFTMILTDIHRLVRDELASRPTFPSHDSILAAIDNAIDTYCDNPATTETQRAEYRNAMRLHYNLI